MRIVIPSYKRAGNVITRRLIPDAILYVSESQYPFYREKEGGEIKRLPDEYTGNMAKIRNFILNDCFAKDENVVMMDDDISAVGYHERSQLFDVKEDYFRDFLEDGFGMAKEMKVYLWGVNLQYAPMFYMEYNPININVPVLGPLTCHIKNDLRYDEQFPMKEDYDFFLQHVNKFRKVLRFDKWYYKAKHIDNAGGCVSRRCMDEEIRQNDLLVKKWGKNVVRYDIKKSINPIINVPF